MEVFRGTATECHLPYGITQCYLLPTQVNTPRLNPSHAGRYSIYLPRRDGRLSWPSWLDSAPAGSQTCDLSITSPTLNQCNHQDNPVYSLRCNLAKLWARTKVDAVGLSLFENDIGLFMSMWRTSRNVNVYFVTISVAHACCLCAINRSAGGAQVDPESYGSPRSDRPSGAICHCHLRHHRARVLQRCFPLRLLPYRNRSVPLCVCLSPSWSFSNVSGESANIMATRYILQ